MKKSPMPPRKTPMRRTPLRSVAPRERTSTGKAPSKAMPGPSAVERLVVAVRADFRCELCGEWLGAYDGENVVWSRHHEHSFHHRQPRGSGGTRDPLTNTPPRLLLLCGSATSPGCHQMVESQRALAYANGWLVKRPTDPATVPVDTYAAGRVYLTPEGTYEGSCTR